MTDTANLEDGFYWVRSDKYFGWIPCRIDSGAFYVVGSDESWNQTYFDEIDPRPIKREDAKTKSWMDNITDLDSMGAGFSGG